jgi:AraC-like DNA-binding protein
VHKFEQVSNTVRLLTFTPGFIEVDHRSMQLVEKVFAIHEDRLPYLDCSEEGIAYLDPIFTMIQEERQRTLCDWDLVTSLVHCFLRYVLRFSNSEASKDEKDIRVSQLINLIEVHYKQEKSCQFYSNELALTSKRLNEIVKAEKNKTVTQLIHDRVILEANRSLVFSTKTIKTIAIELGYEDPAYFSRFYRKQMHESPAAFRVRCADSAT